MEVVGFFTFTQNKQVRIHEYLWGYAHEIVCTVFSTQTKSPKYSWSPTFIVQYTWSKYVGLTNGQVCHKWNEKNQRDLKYKPIILSWPREATLYTCGSWRLQYLYGGLQNVKHWKTQVYRWNSIFQKTYSNFWTFYPHCSPRASHKPLMKTLKWQLFAMVSEIRKQNFKQNISPFLWINHSFSLRETVFLKLIYKWFLWKMNYTKPHTNTAPSPLFTRHDIYGSPSNENLSPSEKDPPLLRPGRQTSPQVTNEIYIKPRKTWFQSISKPVITTGKLLKWNHVLWSDNAW